MVGLKVHEALNETDEILMQPPMRLPFARKVTFPSIEVVTVIVTAKPFEMNRALGLSAGVDMDVEVGPADGSKVLNGYQMPLVGVNREIR